MKRTHLEDFEVGQRDELGSFSMTKEEIIEFATQFDPQVFHTDEAAAENSSFGGLVASGWHTCAKLMRTMCDAYLLDAASGGSPGVENISWLKPVRPGDVISAVRTTLEVRPSRSKPDRGMVLSEVELTNQKGERVMTMRAWSMLFRRSASQA